MRIMGHSTVVVSQQYVHPTPESLERAFQRLELMNQGATLSLPGDTVTKRTPEISPAPLQVPPIFTTSNKEMSDNVA